MSVIEKNSYYLIHKMNNSKEEKVSVCSEYTQKFSKNKHKLFHFTGIHRNTIQDNVTT